MTKVNVLFGAATIALATAMSGAASAGELAGSLDKTGDAVKAAIELSDVTHGIWKISEFAFSVESGLGTSDAASLSGEFSYADILSVSATADFGLATGDTSLGIAASAEQVQTDYGSFSFGISISEDALSASFDLTDVSNDFLANANFGLDFKTDYGVNSSLGVNANGRTVHGVDFTLGADLDLKDLNQSNVAVKFSKKF